MPRRYTILKALYSILLIEAKERKGATVATPVKNHNFVFQIWAISLAKRKKNNLTIITQGNKALNVSSQLFI